MSGAKSPARRALMSSDGVDDTTKERFLPDLYVVDVRGKVMLSRVRAEELLAHQDSLPPEIERVVLRAIPELHLQPERIFIDVPEGFQVTVTELSGYQGMYYGVFVFPHMTDMSQTAILAKEYGLSPRETEVAERVAIGQGTARIAQELRISTSTVLQHLKSAMSKTHSSGRVELITTLLGTRAATK